MEENIVEERSLLTGVEENDSAETNQQDQDVVVLENGKQKFDRPADIPDHFWNEEEGSYKADEILKALKEEQQKALSLRQKLSKGFHNVPQTADHYSLEAEDLEIDEEELSQFKTIAHKNGLTQEQFNSLIKDLHETYSEEEEANAYNTQLSEAYAQKMYEEEMGKLGPDGKQVITNIRSWGRSLLKQGVINQEHFDTLVSMPVSANEIKLLDILRNVSGHIANIPTGIGESTDHASEAEIHKILASPDYEKDPVLQRKVKDYYERVYR
ncbi:MAG: hypothetical protein K0M45_00335 [Candidatus Paracaedibacteraceae bacterium]|nr:hypothetical protein [Candidatus Paracaedibacteraceae bacterium]